MVAVLEVWTTAPGSGHSGVPHTTRWAAIEADHAGEGHLGTAQLLDAVAVSAHPFDHTRHNTG
jgi:hypothetical protein